jgi:PadR family transcriptional regulator PadR
MLYNLEAKGLIEGTERTAASGRERRYYRLTRSGRAQLADQTRQWLAIAQAMQALGILPEPAAGREAVS